VACTLYWRGNGHFAYVKRYIFVHLSSTPTSILNLTISPESQWNIDSNYILSVRKYCPLFTHESNAFTSFCSFKQMGVQTPKNSRSSPFLLRHVDPHLIHQCLGPLHSPCPMTAQSVHALPRNFATKSPLVTMGRPKFTPKTAPSPSMITTKIQYTHSSTDPSHHPKRHPDPISRFATAHFCWPKDRPTDGQVECSVQWELRWLCW